MDESGKKWVIIMFMGEYNYTIDDKGRLTIPSKFREKLGSNFIVTRGLDKCLFVYPKEEWDNVISKYKELPNTKDARAFMRFFLSGADQNDFDKQGRINIVSSLKSYANLTKDCVIIGVNERIEIWDKESWDKFITDNEENLSDIAEKLFTVEYNA